MAHKDIIILSIDVSNCLRNALIKFLQDNGYDEQDIDVWNGKIVLEDLRQNKVGLVISEREMPRLDDIDMFAVMRSEERCSKPVSFLYPRQSQNRKRLMALSKKNQIITSSKKIFNKQLIRYSRRDKK